MSIGTVVCVAALLVLAVHGYTYERLDLLTFWHLWRHFTMVPSSFLVH